MSAAWRDSTSGSREQSRKQPILNAHGQVPKLEGRVLGGFRLAREIASGGMAAVYLAHRAQHARIGQTAAVKVIHSHLAREEDFIEMFLDEARIASCITHPNVCRVLDFGMADGTYYLAMEYVMGETLADVLERLSTSGEAERIGTPLLLQIVAQACEGLHAAHEARDAQGKSLNIVHRDISPQNIMIGYDGSVRILDFGVASAADRIHTTRNGKIKGRLAYMAPEQMSGRPIDRRADLWSLGVVLWEGLSGKRLFKRDDELATMVAVTREPIPSLADCGRPIPASLQSIVTRALRRDRESRYASARDLGLALSRSAMTPLPRAGMPELSVWMQSLFADCIEQKRALLRNAVEAVVSPEGPVTPSARATPLVPETYANDDDAQTRIEIPRFSSRPANSGRAPLPRRRRLLRRGLLSAVTMLLLAIPTPGRAPAAEEVQEHALRPAPAAASKGTPRPHHPTLHVEPVAKKATERHAQETFSPGALVPAQVAAQAPPMPAAALPVEAIGQGASAQTPAAGKPMVGIVTIVATDGWANVYLGTRKLGTTPLRVWLPVGMRSLRLVPFGRGPSILRRVTVDSTENAQLKVMLGG